MEVLSCQSVSSIINFLFVLKVKECIPNDQQRASYSAKCYAAINCCSGLLQFCVIPFLMKQQKNNEKCDTRSHSQQQHEQNRKLWLLMPLTIMVCATVMIYEAGNLSLFLVTGSFSLFKVMEYSIRGVVVEMVYVSLDYESRFYGKEVIGLFVDRLGKSSSAVVLSFVSGIFGQSPSLDRAFVQALSVASLLWLFASYPLAHQNIKAKME
jgi:ATP/ADP translocase